MSYLDRVNACNRLDLTGMRPFRVDGEDLGWIGPRQAAVLAAHANVFAVTENVVTFAPHLRTPAERSAAVAEISPALAASGLYGRLRGELYAIKSTWEAPTAFTLDRALATGFGVRAYGVHINGFVRRGNDTLLWIGTRADDREVEPGKLDNMVAGGQPAHLSLTANLIKECAEEADIAPDLARTAQPAGAISYAFTGDGGVKAGTLFCYDLPLAPDVVPRNTDGEIARFDLMPVGDVLKLVRDTTRFKFNVNLVILDFAIRHGHLDPEREPDFERIMAALYAGTPPNQRPLIRNNNELVARRSARS